MITFFSLLSQKLFEGAKVEKVNTMNNDGKVRRRGYTVGRTNSYKKAIVTLTSDSKEIELFIIWIT